MSEEPAQPPAHETAPTSCPNCSAQMTWNAVAGQLECGHCGHLLAAQVDLGARIVEHDLEAELRSARPPKGALGAGSKQMRCKECGATVEFPDNVTARRCDFCDSPSVLAEAAQTDHYLPESLLPFGVSREQAISSFRGWLGRLWFRPSNLKQKASVTELHGVYVPWWTFDADVHSRWTADAGYYYYVTESYTTTVNGKQVTRTRQVRKVRWVPARGSRDDHHDDHLVCASRGLPSALAVKVADFDTARLVPYTKEVLQGFSAESYAVELPEAWHRAQEGIADIQEARCARDVPGDTHRHLRCSHRFSDTSFKHVLLPVWIAAFRYKDQVHRFLVNGQTGKVAGTAPWSWVKITLFVLLLAAIAVGLFLVFSKK